MSISDIIYILIIIVPGILSENISQLFDIPSDKQRNEFGELVNGVILSCPIVLITFLIYYNFKHFKTTGEYIKYISKPNNLVIFTLILLGVTVLFGVFKQPIKKCLMKLINLIRQKFGAIEIDNRTCWRKMFLDNSDSHYIVIEINDKEYSGLTKWYSLPSEEKEIVLERPMEWKYYPDIEKKFTIVNNIYINIEKNIVIKDYDMEDYNKYCKEESNKI
jgi:hypothetical protein